MSADRWRRHRGRNLLGTLLLSVWICALLRGIGHNSERLLKPTFVIPSGLAKQAVPPVGSLMIGFGLYAFGGSSTLAETISIVLIYFGAQTGMNLYMKNVLSKIVVDEGLKGIPIGFLLTAIQQLVAFVAFTCFLLVGKVFNKGYQVKKLTTSRECIAIICFSMAFAFNIGLNNFSLSLVAISINMIIRSCSPLCTALSQMVLGSFMGSARTKIRPVEWMLMIAGVGCAALATYAKSASGHGTGESAGLVLGVIVCVASIFSGAVNMVLAGVLGTSMKLNPVDSTCYMALPAGLVLLLPAFLVYHPMGQWPDHDDMTDWQVLREVIDRNPMALAPVFFSGVLAFVYNILQYSLVHKLSATHATFASNFNKAAAVALSLILGLETLPQGFYGYVFLTAIAGNIAAFSMYSALKAAQPPKSAAQGLSELECTNRASGATH